MCVGENEKGRGKERRFGEPTLLRAGVCQGRREMPGVGRVHAGPILWRPDSYICYLLLIQTVTEWFQQSQFVAPCDTFSLTATWDSARIQGGGLGGLRDPQQPRVGDKVWGHRPSDTLSVWPPQARGPFWQGRDYFFRGSLSKVHDTTWESFPG